MLTREQIEEQEEQRLAPYAAHSGRSQGRKYPETEHPYRSAFQRDRDRVIHSAAFRRLEYKTQVFVNHEGDYYRTRLTHSMETAQIARTLARTLRLNEDLCEVLALSHDLGHTPFGHAGQDALHECMKDHGGFEHNIQSLRIVEVLEQRYPDFPGLNLTFEARESIRKHTVRPDLPVPGEYHPEWGSLLESQLVDTADSIAYDAHDIDDSVEAGLLEESVLDELDLWRECAAEVKKRWPDLDVPEIRVKQTVRFLINREVSDLVQNTEREIQRLGIDSVEKVRAAKQRVVDFSPDVRRKKMILQEFLHRNVYRHHRVVVMQDKAARFIRALFEAYVSNIGQLPPRYRALAKEVGVHRAAADYLAGMTDRYAQMEYKKLFHPFESIL